MVAINFYFNLQNAVSLRDCDDESKWSYNKASKVLIVELVYEEKISEGVEEERRWWWKIVWKMHTPLKIRIFLCLVLERKILTWDNKEKMNWVDPSWCFYAEVKRLATCPFIKVVEKGVYQSLNIQHLWKKDSLLEFLEDWVLDSFVAKHRPLPC